MSHGAQTKAKILEIGAKLWALEMGVSASRIASVLDMTHGAVLYHFENADGMRDEIAAYAVRNELSGVIRHLIALRHPAVADMPDDVKLKHMNTP